MCRQGERPIFSFQVEKSGKLVSIFKEANDQYLLYRFGALRKIELQSPQEADTESWSKFEFSGYFRGGGIQNDAMEDYALKFINNQVEYTIFQNWRLEADEYQIGVMVTTPDARVLLKGEDKNQVGSLMSLEGNPAIPNTWYSSDHSETPRHAIRNQ